MGKIKFQYKNKAFSIFIFLLIVSFFYCMSTISRLDNYFNWLSLLLSSTISGIISGMIFYQLIIFYFEEIKSYRNKKGIGFKFVIISFNIMLFIGVSRGINETKYLYSVCKNFKLENTLESSGRHKQYFVIIENNDNKFERLDFGRQYFSEVANKDSIKLCLHTGLLGFKFYQKP